MTDSEVRPNIAPSSLAAKLEAAVTQSGQIKSPSKSAFSSHASPNSRLYFQRYKPGINQFNTI